MNIHIQLRISNPARKGDKFIELKHLSQRLQSSGFQPVCGDVFDVKGYVSEQEIKEVTDYGCRISPLLFVDSRLYNVSTQTLNITLKDRI